MYFVVTGTVLSAEGTVKFLPWNLQFRARENLPIKYLRSEITSFPVSSASKVKGVMRTNEGVSESFKDVFVISRM